MALTKQSIEQHIKTGNIVYHSRTPNNPIKINTNSIDVSLSPYIFITVANDLGYLDPKQDMDLSNFYKPLHMSHEGYILKPNEFILASVNERFECHKAKVIQHYDGRSTCARMGIQSHLSAGFGDFGFIGSFTLEIKNNAPFSVKIYPNMYIGQVYFIPCVGETPTHYNGYDQTDFMPHLPRIGKNRF